MQNILRSINDAMWADHERTKELLTFSKVRQLIKKASTGGTTIDKPEKDVSEDIKKVEKSNQQNNNNGEKKKTYTTAQLISLILGPLLFVIILYVAPLAGLSFKGKAVLATMVWVIAWWVGEPVAVGGTSLIPMVALPILGAVKAADASKAYADPLVMLFLGGFALALALEKWRLHERIALTVIGFFSGSLSGVIVGVLCASFFISMWVSNTATTMMVLPIATAVAAKVISLLKEEGSFHSEDGKNFTTAMILSTAFGATIGGSSTIIGTPANTILSGLVTKLTGVELAFGNFMLFATPLCLLILLFCGFYITKVGYPLKVKKLKAGKTFIIEEKKKLGQMSYEEKAVGAIFALTVFFWVTRTFLWANIIPGISDTMVAIAGAILIYAWPNSSGGRLLEGDSFGKMPWSVLLMIGAGLSVAVGFTGTDLAAWVGNQMLGLKGSSYYVILFASLAIGLFVTQFAPNTATATILIPISGALGFAVGFNPIPLMTATALGAGYAITFPIGTPSLGIIYATGKITQKDMIKTGGYIILAMVITIMLFLIFVFPPVLGVDPMEALKPIAEAVPKK